MGQDDMRPHVAPHQSPNQALDYMEKETAMSDNNTPDLFDDDNGLHHPQPYARKTAKREPYTKRPFPQLYKSTLIRIGRDAHWRMQRDHEKHGRVTFGDKLHATFNEVQQYFVRHGIPLKGVIPRRVLSAWCREVSGRSRDRGLTQLCQLGLLEVLTPGEARDWLDKHKGDA
jgi:hypothetical protein